MPKGNPGAYGKTKKTPSRRSGGKAKMSNVGAYNTKRPKGSSHKSPSNGSPGY